MAGGFVPSEIKPGSGLKISKADASCSKEVLKINPMHEKSDFTQSSYSQKMETIKIGIVDDEKLFIKGM